MMAAFATIDAFNLRMSRRDQRISAVYLSAESVSILHVIPNH